jgi:hypothetical protein
MTDPTIKPLSLSISVEPDGNGRFRVLTNNGGGGAWGVGPTFPTSDAAIDVANAIAEAWDGTSHVDTRKVLGL